MSVLLSVLFPLQLRCAAAQRNGSVCRCTASAFFWTCPDREEEQEQISRYADSVEVMMTKWIVGSVFALMPTGYLQDLRQNQRCPKAVMGSRRKTSSMTIAFFRALHLEIYWILILFSPKGAVDDIPSVQCDYSVCG